MLRPLLVSVATVLALATPVVPAATAADDVPAARAGGITGTWKGKVVNQDGPAGYSGTIRLTRSGGKYRAKVRYSGGVSATTWIYEGRRGGWFRFREIPKSSSGPGGVAAGDSPPRSCRSSGTDPRPGCGCCVGCSSCVPRARERAHPSTCVAGGASSASRSATRP